MDTLARPVRASPARAAPARRAARCAIGYADRYLALLILVAPVQSVVLSSIQGTTPAFVLTLLSLGLLAGSGARYLRLLMFVAAFLVLYVSALFLSLSGYLFDQPDLSNAQVIRQVFIYGYLRQTHVTQGLYLFAVTLFGYLVRLYWRDAFLKYMFWALVALTLYGFYEFAYYAWFGESGDFLSNRTFGDAATNRADRDFVTGSLVQQSNLFGPGYMRLKSLTGEPSMYALTVAPFAVYAYGRRWWGWFAILFAGLALAQASTGLLGLLVGVGILQVVRDRAFVVYLGFAVVSFALLYATSDGVREAVDTLLFRKLDSDSGMERSRQLVDHALIAFDGNIVRLLFGVGFGTVRSIDMFSNLLANVGVVGLLLYSALFLYPCLALRRSADRWPLVAALLALFVMEMLTVSEYGYLPPWFLLGMAYARLAQERVAAAPAFRGAARA